MGHVIFNKESYEYGKTGFFSSFHSNDRHYYLLDYVDKDVSSLPELFVQYISERIDTKTMNIKTLSPEDSKKNEDKLNGIIKTMKATHPYYEYEYKEIVINRIAKYFIDLLLYYSKSSDPVSEEFFDDGIIYLTQPLLSISCSKKSYEKFLSSKGISGSDFSYAQFLLLNNISFPNKFYEEYKESMGKTKTIVTDEKNNKEKLEGEGIIIPPENPMDSEIMSQNTIYDMLYFTLDIDAQGLNELTTSQRIWLYNKTHPYEQSIYVNKQLSYEISHYDVKTKPGQETKPEQEAKAKQEMDNALRPLYGLYKFDVGHKGIPEDMMKNLESAVKYAKKINDSNIYEKYEINNLRELLYLEWMSMIQSGTKIRKCKNCGKYFVVNSPNVKYCNRITASGKPCSKVGPKLSYKKKMESDNLRQMLNKAYDTHYHRVDRGGKKSMTSKELDKWLEEAKKKLDEVKAGKLSMTDYQAWLKI